MICLICIENDHTSRLISVLTSHLILSVSAGISSILCCAKLKYTNMGSNRSVKLRCTYKNCEVSSKPIAFKLCS